MDPQTLQVIGVLFIATLVRSAFGFGEALIAVPLLALIIPVEVAAPLAVLASITVALMVVLQDRGDVQVGSAARLVLWTLPGVPLGLLLLVSVEEAFVKAILALVIIAFSLYSLGMGRTAAVTDDRFAWFFGFGAGVLGGAYGMNGPPLVVYGSLRGWRPRQFRATLQGYFLPASMVVMFGYWLAGLWSSTVTSLYLVSLPILLIAVPAGRTINRSLRPERFQVYLHVALVIIGVGLIAQAVGG